MKTYPYYFVDVFTSEPFGGNPLAVFPEAEGLNTEQMQALAREINFSETTFVFAPAKSHLQPQQHARVRIFTPRKEIPFAGHPTLGTAWVLQKHFGLTTEGLILAEGVGDVEVKHQAGYWELKTAQKPEFDVCPLDKKQLAAFLNLPPEAIGYGEYQPQIVSCGLPYLVVPVGNLAAIQGARYNWPEEHPVLAVHPELREVYLFCPETVSAPVDYHVRMFAPWVGVPEDPATGSAAATLAAYLQATHTLTSGQWALEQGHEMGRPSQLWIRVAGSDVFVKGQVQLQSRGEWYLPSAQADV